MSRNNVYEDDTNPLAVLFVGLCVLLVMFGLLGCADSQPYTGTTHNKTSREHRYVEQRMRREGMSNKEARQAADAVIKFHEAQKARQR